MTDSTGRGHADNQGQENWRHAERLLANDALDEELDRLLTRYAAVEPRAGLEDRILANLHAQQPQAPFYVGWRWAWAGAVTVGVLVLALSLAWRTSKPPLGKATEQRMTQDSRDTQIATSASPPHLPARPLASVKTTAAHRPRSSTATVGTAPHLERFPSPQPLSEQEKILERYVAMYPEHAAQVAEARAEALRRDAVEEMRSLAGEQKLQP